MVALWDKYKKSKQLKLQDGNDTNIQENNSKGKCTSYFSFNRFFKYLLIISFVDAVSNFLWAITGVQTPANGTLHIHSRRLFYTINLHSGPQKCRIYSNTLITAFCSPEFTWSYAYTSYAFIVYINVEKVVWEILFRRSHSHRCRGLHWIHHCLRWRWFWYNLHQHYWAILSNIWISTDSLCLSIYNIRAIFQRRRVHLGFRSRLVFFRDVIRIFT